MKRLTLYFFIVFFILSMSFSPEEPLAAQYYEGKVIKIIVGHGAGPG